MKYLMLVVVLRPQVQPPQWGVPALLLLLPEPGLQDPGGGELLQPLPLLWQLQPAWPGQSQPGGERGETDQEELYNVHAGN